MWLDILFLQNQLTSRTDVTKDIVSLLEMFPDTKLEVLQHCLDAAGGDMETATMLLLENQKQQPNINREYNEAASKVGLDLCNMYFNNFNVFY